MDRGHVSGAERAGRIDPGRIVADQDDRAEADDEGQDVEIADPACRPEHRRTSLAGVGHGEEAHEDVRKAGRAEHQGHAEGNGRDRIGEEGARPHDGEAFGGCSLGAQPGGGRHLCLHLDSARKEGFGREAELGQDRKGHDRRAAEQEHRLDDLHPGRGDHSAEQDVERHQHADDQDRVNIIEVEQQFDQLPGADHLRDQVEEHDGECRDRREAPDRQLGETERGDIGERIFAEIAQPLRHQEEDERPADQEADRVDQPVIAYPENLRGDAEEGGRGHIVAGNGETVAEARDAAARSVEIRPRLRPPRRPAGDDQSERDEAREHPDGGPVWAGSAHSLSPRRRASTIGSYSLFARRT